MNLKNAINRGLRALTHGRYFDKLPIGEIQGVFVANGIAPDLAAEKLGGIYCGHEGRVHEQIAPKLFWVLTWYQMPSGRYEINTYVS